MGAPKHRWLGRVPRTRDNARSEKWRADPPFPKRLALPALKPAFQKEQDVNSS